MYIPHRLPTSNGRALTREPARLTIPAPPVAALAFAEAIDRDADFALGEGRFALAERLSYLALEARCRATGCRA